jgi:CelD/BcsL family acetyltransferase involved in cellulose biosynthesis
MIALNSKSLSPEANSAPSRVDQAGSGLRVDVVRPHELTGDLVESWRRILQNGVQQNNPFLHPEFTRAVAAVRNDVEVAVLRHGAAPVGFFPFQRSAWNIGKPVGGRLSNYQGLVVEKEVEWSALELVRGAGLSTWAFDQLDLALSPFERHARDHEGAAYFDLSNGYEAYREERRSTGSQRILKIESLYRKLCREAGPIQTHLHQPDAHLIETLIGWKSSQFRETGQTDVFSCRWTVDLLHNILGRENESFAPVVSALCSGSRPIAISYALRTQDVLHGMFIGYDRDYSKYSPGLIMMLEIAKEAAARGVRRFHLGSGGDHYKKSLTSAETRVGIGSVDCQPLVAWSRRGWEMARRAVHSKALSPFSRLPLKLLRPLREHRSLR